MLAVAAASLRRVAGPAGLGLALAAGALAGLCLRGLPAPDLASQAHGILVLVFGGLVCLPIVAALPTAERAGGGEGLVAVRPIGSPAWVFGRLLGAALGASTLVLVIATVSRILGGDLSAPVLVSGERFDAGLSSPTYRFALPAGVAGPFELRVPTLSARPEGAPLLVEIARGAHARALPPVHVKGRRASVMVPDLAPERGDLHVTLRPDRDLLLGRDVPKLLIGRRALGSGALPLPLEPLGKLGFACLAALAVGCAFHFPTACLAGLLALCGSSPSTPWAWAAASGALVVIAISGTAIMRRSLPA